jgi:hypothetical protein
MKPILFSNRKISSILMLLFSLLISITLGAYNFLLFENQEAMQGNCEKLLK